MRRTRATFEYVQSHFEDAIFIIDLKRGMSVTNDADAVVAEVLRLHPGKRIVYRDTLGSWDELRHDGLGFTGFAPLSIEDRRRFSRVVDAIPVGATDKSKAIIVETSFGFVETVASIKAAAKKLRDNCCLAESTLYLSSKTKRPTYNFWSFCERPSPKRGQTFFVAHVYGSEKDLTRIAQMACARGV